ncbi:DMT family transporter [Spirochaeta cellobiosiphila]|uniref:DMT family transporter n=1 Tax=Spirochaeta cellobiosiphila TaxID=504483 RepID=UPI00040773CB|nr:DMT family transporter [Spirochaeta cellobiosiphila]
MKNKLLPYGALILAIYLWGISFILTRALLDRVSPALFIPLRFLIALLLFLPFQRKYPLPSKKELLLMLAISLFQPGLYFIGETYAIENLGPSLTSLLIGTIPLFTAIGSWMLFKQKPKRNFWIGFVLSMLGLWLLFFPLPIPREQAFIGFGAILLAIITAACYMILTNKVSQNITAIQISFWQFLFGFIFFLPWALVTRPALPEDLGMTSLLLVIMAIGPTAGAFFTYNYALSKMSANKASLGLNLIPIVTVVTGMMIYKEVWTTRQLAVALIVVLGLIIGNLKFKKPLPE